GLKIHLDIMRRRKSFNISVKRFGTRRIFESEISLHMIAFQLGRNTCCKNGLYLRSEMQRPIVPPVIQRLHSHPVAHQVKLLSIAVEVCKSKITVESLQRGESLLSE